MEHYFSSRLRELFEAYKSKMTSQAFADAPSTESGEEGEWEPTEAERKKFSHSSESGSAKSGHSHKNMLPRSLRLAGALLKKWDKTPERSEVSRQQAINHMAGAIRSAVHRREVGAELLDQPSHPAWHHPRGVLRGKPGIEQVLDLSLKAQKHYRGREEFAKLFQSEPPQPKERHIPTKALQPLEGSARVRMTGGLVLGKGRAQRVQPFKPVSGEEMSSRLRELLKQASAVKPG
jgi:hypothetical protein